MVNAIIHFPISGMHTFLKINMNLIQQRWYQWPFFWCLAHELDDSVIIAMQMINNLTYVINCCIHCQSYNRENFIE